MSPGDLQGRGIRPPLRPQTLGAPSGSWSQHTATVSSRSGIPALGASSLCCELAPPVHPAGLAQFYPHLLLQRTANEGAWIHSDSHELPKS